MTRTQANCIKKPPGEYPTKAGPPSQCSIKVKGFKPGIAVTTEKQRFAPARRTELYRARQSPLSINRSHPVVGFVV